MTDLRYRHKDWSFTKRITMAASEIIPGVYMIRGKFADEFGFISSYIVVSGESVLVIDPGTAGDPGDNTIELIRNLGLGPGDVVGILCTHGHPDHVGGAYRLKKKTGAPVLIGEDDAPILEEPQLFLKERMFLDVAERMTMKVDRGPLRVNYKGVEPFRKLCDGDTVNVGDITLHVIHTGGHSAGHCVFHERANKILFTGDEASNFPNDPRKFYIDLSGSMAARSNAISSMKALGADYLLPGHDIPHLFEDVRLLLEQVGDGIIHFQDSILHHLEARDEADVEQLVFDIRESRSIPIPQTYEFLLVTTITVVLQGLQSAGLVRADDRGVWTRI
ncbi:MAG: MBL fold metallo-hydrolase [Candidatus Thorarchaeota archaeon]